MTEAGDWPPGAGPSLRVDAPVRSRLDSIDWLRGIVMVLMVLDHVRDYYGDGRNPMAIGVASPALYFTRWITHFCAPVFVFLAGTSAWLYASRGRSKWELSRFLISRGLMLVVLEFTAVAFGWMHVWGLVVWQVIAAIGVAMIALGVLVHLPRPVLVALALAIALGHNALDRITLEDAAPYAPLWRFVHEGIIPQFGLVELGPFIVLAVYPVLPWTGVMLLGYAFGPLTGLEAARRRRVLLGLGTSMTLTFVLLSFANGYGDPAPWSGQATTGDTLLSFLNTTKYPPSLSFLLMTLGPALVVLGLLDKRAERGGRRGPIGRALIVIGRVPLFFYVLHIYLVHGSARLFHWLRFGSPISPPRSQLSFLSQFGYEQFAFEPLPAEFTPIPIWGFYVVSLLVALALYPLCA